MSILTWLVLGAVIVVLGGGYYFVRSCLGAWPSRQNQQLLPTYTLRVFQVPYIAYPPLSYQGMFLAAQRATNFGQYRVKEVPWHQNGNVAAVV